MSVSSISQQAYALPQITAQQVSAAAAVSDDAFDESDAQAGATSSASSAAAGVSGSATGQLSSQTLQALFNLTQNNPAQNDPSSQQATQGTQPHHHHHHGGGAAQQPAAQNTSTSTANDPTASIAELDSSTTGSDDSDSLATALGA